ncbi:MAG: hypothetical protein HFP77_01250 [Methylococcales symbiont of Iophon sp. n. MRB-2018]|nr:MAG: hypothetical protein HFP77_01250 [Methylococcales symbiont of Iophon sp. n. MRB-2018]KAF3980549.1 MAG: hypothetical protein HFP76_01470 [Methylococcales symbiont of Iophon sp. n. MRB-2018]
MTRKQLRKTDPKEGEILPNEQDNGYLINQTIVQILIEKDGSGEIKELMRAELDYNREKLEIIREHTKLHPDAIEERKSICFRRYQYVFLMLFLIILLPTIFFMPTAIALALSTIVIIITSGVVLNGRERDDDSKALLSLLSKLTKR